MSDDYPPRRSLTALGCVPEPFRVDRLSPMNRTSCQQAARKEDPSSLALWGSYGGAQRRVRGENHGISVRQERQKKICERGNPGAGFRLSR